MRRRIAVAVLLTAPAVASAHPFESSQYEIAGLQWNFDPAIVASLALFVVLYARGLRRLPRAMWKRRGAAFVVGVMALIAALLSPIDVLSDELSSVHMVQHMILINVVAPLLVLATPAIVVLHGIPRPYRPAIGRFARQVDRSGAWNPWVVGLVFAIVFWLWHLPTFYLAALRDPVVHDLEHITFFVAAFFFWRLVLDPISRRRLSSVATIVLLFVTSLHMMALGVLMTFAGSVWYADYESRTLSWGLSAIEDQQLAGVIMWMPGGVVYAIVAAGRLMMMIEDED